MSTDYHGGADDMVIRFTEIITDVADPLFGKNFLFQATEASPCSACLRKCSRVLNNQLIFWSEIIWHTNQKYREREQQCLGNIGKEIFIGGLKYTRLISNNTGVEMSALQVRIAGFS